MQPGPTNSLHDIGLRVGHDTQRGTDRLTGCTAILAPDGGMTAGVDVRGGGPGTRETDLLAPTATMETVHAVVLTGGSAFGLAAASGAADELADRGIGFAVGAQAGEVVPIVPAAVLFDLGRGGSFRGTPDESSGRRAVRQAMEGSSTELGTVGAGTGAVIAGIKGGLGMASAVLGCGATIAALVVVNALGSPTDRMGGGLAARDLLLPGDADDLRSPPPSRVADVLRATRPRQITPTLPTAQQAVQNTTIGLIGTTARLTKNQCGKLAALAHDGLARTINPIHSMFDGDTIFGVSTGSEPPCDIAELHEILCAAADVTSRAVIRAIAAAETVSTAAGTWQSYADLVDGAGR